MPQFAGLTPPCWSFLHARRGRLLWAPLPCVHHLPQIKTCWSRGVLRQKAGAPTAVLLQPSLGTLLTVGLKWLWCVSGCQAYAHTHNMIACAQVMVRLIQVSKPSAWLHTDCGLGGPWQGGGGCTSGLLQSMPSSMHWRGCCNHCLLMDI